MSNDATLDEFGEENQKSTEDSVEVVLEHTVESSLDETSAGDIPENWIATRLGSIAEETEYGLTESAEEYDPDKPRYIRTQDFDDFGDLNRDSRASLSQQKAKDGLLEMGDILFARSGSVGASLGKTYLYDTSDGDCCFGGYSIRHHLQQEGLNHKYISEYTLSEQYWDWVRRRAKTTAQSNINTGEYGSLLIPIPPLSEQRKIATVLHTVDQAIQKTEEIIEQVRTIKQGILQDLMSGAGSDRQFEEKRVGPRVVSLPKDWEVVQIGDALESDIIFQQQDGNHGSDYPRKDEFVDEGVPYLSAEMLSEGEVDFSQAKYLTEERANQLRIGFAKDGDVLLAHNATVGPTGLLETTRNFVIIGTSLTYYRCNPDKLNSQYMTYFFQSGTFQKQLQDVMRQSTRNQVPITRQRNLHLILPPIQQQREISNQIDTVNEKLQTENQYREGLKRLKRSLMQDLLSGEVRTTDTDIDILEEVAKYG